MRTKTSLLTAAIIAGGISAASAQVYSQNVVGYVNVVIPPNSFVLATTPLMGTTNDLTTLFAGITVPDNNTLKIWTYIGGGNFAIYTKRTTGAWTPAGAPLLNPGVGYFIQNANTTVSLTNTYVGDVLQGTNQPNMAVAYTGDATTPVFNLIGCPTPTAGLIKTELGFNPNPVSTTKGDTIYQLDVPTQSYLKINKYTTRPSPWSPGPEPTIGVAEGFWLEATASGTWQRNFTVQ